MKKATFSDFRKFENAHILLWLIKDMCWAAGFHWGGTVMIIPTVFVAIYLTWQARKEMVELAHNLAVCMWIAANSTWMVGEFFFEDATKPVAIIFFALGLLILIVFYLSQWINDSKQRHKEESTFEQKR